jgi:hypothetical protein
LRFTAHTSELEGISSNPSELGTGFDERAQEPRDLLCRAVGGSRLNGATEVVDALVANTPQDHVQIRAGVELDDRRKEPMWTLAISAPTPLHERPHVIDDWVLLSPFRCSGAVPVR